MTTVVLIRHGETDWNKAGRLQGREEVPLNHLGRLQARRCADFLRNFTWDAIVSSPMKRARETAGIIQEALGDTVSLVDMHQFMERDYGIASGLTVEERSILYPSGENPGLEPWEELCQRSMDGLEHVRERFQDKKILIVAHGGVINSILATISGGEIGTGKTRLLNTSRSQIQFLQSAWQVDYFNQAQHLTE